MARAKKIHHQRSRALQQLPGDIEGEGLWLAEVGLLPWQRQRGLVALLCGVICAQRGWRKQFEAEHSDYWRASAENGSACLIVSNEIQFAAFCGVDGVYIRVTGLES